MLAIIKAALAYASTRFRCMSTLGFAGLEAEAADERSDDWNQDQRNERRHPFGNDHRQQHDNRRRAKNGQHGVSSEKSFYRKP
jgi:hypothetical protein